ncbi:MAG: hypothetical protein EA362_02410 [Saprospirales bacterium]|nr:MAG: hypothetical protein EA362_02410 [Saprospirales bacterium]
MISCGWSTSEESDKSPTLSLDSKEELNRKEINSLADELLKSPTLFKSDSTNAIKVIRLTAQNQLREQFRKLMINYFKNSGQENLAGDLLLFADIFLTDFGDRNTSNFIHLNFVEEFPYDNRWNEVAAFLPERMKNSEDIIDEEFGVIFTPDGELESLVAANRFMLFSEIYAISKPNNPASPKYLFKAAEIANALGMESRSDSNIRWMVNEFGDHEITPNALFFKAFQRGEVGEDNIRRMQLLQEFLLLYPDHELAENARLMIQTSGMSGEELLRSFREKEKKGS